MSCRNISRKRVILADITVLGEVTEDEPIPKEATSVFCKPIFIVSEAFIPICISTEFLDPSSKFTPLKLVFCEMRFPEDFNFSLNL